MENLPYLGRDERGLPVLYADGAPYLMLAGEIHNSSSSSLEYMREKVWPGIRGLHLNTLIVPVTWETVEPEEGRFDFTLPEGILWQAREEKMRLVFLWFGLWKNGESTYVPDWVKRDTKRFARACYPGGIPSDTVTPLCREAVRADKKAFREFMRFLREKDGEHHTVLMVQVENEIGFLGADRDYSELAQQAFAAAVPEQLEQRSFAAAIPEQLEQRSFTAAVPEQLARGEVSWTERFGEDAPEQFMAWHYACAVEEIAAAGKVEYPLPMYVNAWLNQFPDRPGTYPSGGPIARNLPVWKTAAKSIDLFAPDIYLSDFDGVCREYTAGGAPLLIPEARRDAVSASNVFPAFAVYHTIGFSPFGIEDFRAEEALEETGGEADKGVLAQLQIDELAFVYNGTGKYLARSYELLDSMKELYFRYRGTKALQGYLQRSEHEKGTILRLANCELELAYRKHPLSEPGCAGMVIEDSEESFFIAGCNTEIRLIAPRWEIGKTLTVLSMEEGQFENGQWIRKRILNGDERYHKTLGSEPSVLRFRYCLG